MRSPGLVVLVVAGLLVVAYAVYTLTGREDGPRPARVEAGADAGSGERDGAARPSARPRASPRGGIKPAKATRIGDARPPPGPPPRPKPKISLDQARQSFADYMAELERLEKKAVKLSSSEWVEYYRRGHETILPLQQHLDWKVPEEAEELRKANESMRNKLRKLEPNVAGQAAAQ